jgi:hypothetical protein
MAKNLTKVSSGMGPLHAMEQRPQLLSGTTVTVAPQDHRAHTAQNYSDGEGLDR